MLQTLVYHFATKINLIIYGIRFKKALFPTGYFVGNFFGVNDEWNDNKTNKTFFTKKQVEELFYNFEVIKLKEIERDGTTGTGEMKYWHFFNVIAKKTNKL